MVAGVKSFEHVPPRPPSPYVQNTHVACTPLWVRSLSRINPGEPSLQLEHPRIVLAHIDLESKGPLSALRIGIPA